MILAGDKGKEVESIFDKKKKKKEILENQGTIL